jgi:hypothetical protein
VFEVMLRSGVDDYKELEGFEWAWQSMDGSLLQEPRLVALYFQGFAGTHSTVWQR